jgi:hypothetical protein
MRVGVRYPKYLATRPLPQTVLTKSPFIRVDPRLSAYCPEHSALVRETTVLNRR